MEQSTLPAELGTKITKLYLISTVDRSSKEVLTWAKMFYAIFLLGDKSFFTALVVNTAHNLRALNKACNSKRQDKTRRTTIVVFYLKVLNI